MAPRSLALRLLISTAIMVLMTWTPVHADVLTTNKSGLVRGLLATVVNLAVRKDEAKSPPSTAASANAPAAPAADAGQNIKSYGGSGFVIDPSGLIVTNYHVVEDAFEIVVGFSDGQVLPGKMLYASRLADLAIVKVEAKKPLASAHWGDSDAVQVGDQVFAVGNPLGVGMSVTAGIVSALNRDIQNSPYDDLIQTDAAINHGNSGGPLFNMRGLVVGVNSAIISPTPGSSGVGFALPSNSARFVFDQLRNYGWVRPGWIGVKIQRVTHEIADALGSALPKASIVSWVMPNGPANKAGLLIGDVILRFDGSAPTDDRALLRDIAHTQAGNTIKLSVWRDGHALIVPITAGVWPRNQWDALDAPTPVSRPKLPILPDLGLGLAALDTEEKAKSGLQDDLSGVLVKSVVRYSDAAIRGIASGDVILRVQDKPVASPDDVLSGITAARTARRAFVLMLILPKERTVPGPKWFALQLGTAGD
jgi:serine protease Do